MNRHRRTPHPAAATDQRPERIDPALLRLAAQPYLAEVLTVLQHRTATLGELRRTTHAPRPALIAALRALAAAGALTRSQNAGSWDGTGVAAGRYHLSPAGHTLIDQLWNPAVWQCLYSTPAIILVSSC